MKIFINLEGDAKRLPINIATVKNALHREGLVCEVRMEALPRLQGQKDRTKDIALTILAVGVAVSAVSVALRNILAPYLMAKALKVEDKTYQPLRNKDGQIVKENNKIVYVVKKRARLLNAGKTASNSASTVEADLVKVLKFKVSSTTSGSGSK